MKVDVISTIRRCAHPALGAALLLCMAGASAQMFKWVDAKGVVHYSDTPPPPSQKKIEVKPFTGGGPAVELPYALAEAVRNNPVTLYTTADCNACDQARTLLQVRGVPFAEKTVNSNDDQQKLKEAGSPGQLPLLLVGGSKLIGFEAGAWNQALSDADYPAQRILPPTYQNPRAEAAAPPKGPSAQALARAAARAAAAADAAETARLNREPPPDVPPGFQF
jgi:glutaredoxin